MVASKRGIRTHIVTGGGSGSLVVGSLCSVYAIRIVVVVGVRRCVYGHSVVVGLDL